MTNKRAAELLSDVIVLDDPEMFEAHNLAISALCQQERICKITNLPCCACSLGPCENRKDVPYADVGKSMTIADRISTMTIEEKAEFLESIAYARETPWSEAFAEKFCKSCPTTICSVEGYSHPLKLNECDFVDGNCPHGRDIVWWLQQPAEEVNHD